MRFLRRSMVGIFLLSVTLALFAWAGSLVYGAVQARINAEPRSFPQRERVLSVNVVTITPETITPELRVFGELRSRKTLELRPSVGGTILEAADSFVEGGTVHAGDVLLRIDPVDAQSALDRLAADLSDGQAEERDAQRALALAQGELAAAQDQATLRESALTRQRDLLDRGVGSASAVETAELAASSARQAVLSRRQAIASAQARIDQAATRMSRVAINLAEAERALSNTEIRAAFDGTLADVTVSDGGRVTANERIGQLIDPTLLEVTFRVSTSQYARLLEDDGTLLRAPIRATLDVAGVDLTATGMITREGAAVGEGLTGRVIFATLDSTIGFRPGDFVTVAIDEPALDNVARLPATALAADGSLLVVGEGDRLREVPVTLMRRQGNDVVISAPELTGLTVVAERSPLLGAGIRVRPIVPGAETSAPAIPKTIALDADRRARLIAFVQESRMPDEAKTRILSQLEQDEVPSDVVTRLEGRMGS